MAENTPNPFENTNSGPTAPAPDAPAADAVCSAATCTKGATARSISRALLYGPVALLFVGIVALWTVPGLANYVSPILSLIDPSLGKMTDKGTGCCSSTMEETGSCCSNLSKAAMLTSSVSSDEISLDSGASMNDDSCVCCEDEVGLCPTTLKGKSDEAADDESDE